MYLLTLSVIVTLLDTTEASKGSSLDLALETVLEFNDAVDPNILNKIKGIVNDIRKTFIKRPQDNRNTNEPPYEFVDFLEGVIIAANTFNDNELVESFDTIHDEINQLDLKELNYLRRYVNKNAANIKHDASKIRKGLDNLLINLRNRNRDRNDNFYLNFINSLYKRNSERKFVDILNTFKVFRRSTRTGEELRAFIKKTLREIISDLNITGDKQEILKIWLDVYKNKLMNDEKLIDIDNYKDTPTVPSYKIKIKNKTIKTTKPKENRVKLTHITLYPEIDKRFFKIDTDKRHEDIETDRNETDTRERVSSSAGDTSKSEDESDVKGSSNEVVKETKREPRTFRTSRYITKKTKYVKKIQDNSKEFDSNDGRSLTTSYELFGNLDKYKKRTLSDKHKSKTIKTKVTSTAKKFKTKNNRRNNYPQTSTVTVISTKEPTKTISLNKMLNEAFKNIPSAHSSTTYLVTSSTSDVTKPDDKSKMTESTNIITYINTLSTNAMPLEDDNKTKTTETTTTTMTTLKSININNLIKTSDINDIENEDKKKLIEQKMKEDLKGLLYSPTTTIATEAYEDIFKGMEDEFELK